MIKLDAFTTLSHLTKSGKIYDSRNQVWYQVCKHVGDQVLNKVCNKVWHQATDKVSSSVRNQVRDKFRNKVLYD